MNLFNSYYKPCCLYFYFMFKLKINSFRNLPVFYVSPCFPSNPCKNGGKCTQISTYDFQCTCQSGYSGSDCLTPTNCVDFSDTWCRYCWFSYSSIFNGVLFANSCPATCRTCSSNPNCRDTMPSCYNMANFCSTLPNPNPCPRTCGIC